MTYHIVRESCQNLVKILFCVYIYIYINSFSHKVVTEGERERKIKRERRVEKKWRSGW